MRSGVTAAAALADDDGSNRCVCVHVRVYVCMYVLCMYVCVCEV